jgi:hypothetical protein
MRATPLCQGWNRWSIRVAPWKLLLLPGLLVGRSKGIFRSVDTWLHTGIAGREARGRGHVRWPLRGCSCGGRACCTASLSLRSSRSRMSSSSKCWYGAAWLRTRPALMWGDVQGGMVTGTGGDVLQALSQLDGEAFGDANAMHVLWGASLLNVLEAAVCVATSRLGLEVTEGIRADFVLPWMGLATRLFAHVWRALVAWQAPARFRRHYLHMWQPLLTARGFGGAARWRAWPGGPRRHGGRRACACNAAAAGGEPAGGLGPPGDGGHCADGGRRCASVPGREHGRACPRHRPRPARIRPRGGMACSRVCAQMIKMWHVALIRLTPHLVLARD